MKRLLLFYAFMLTIDVVWAHDVEIDGIYYNLDETNKTAEVTYKGDEFYYDEEYSGSIDIPSSITINSETYSVISIGDNTFRGCSGLSSITIPNSVTAIGSGAFSGCSSLTFINIPNSVTAIGSSAFSDCSDLIFINIPNSVTSIDSYAFNNCTGLTSITIPNSVTYIGGDVFNSCSGLTEIIVSSNNKYFTSDNGVLFNKDKTKLIQYPIGRKSTTYEVPNSVTSIGNVAFAGCSGLTSITIPNSVTSIDSYAFNNCTGLTSITIPNSVTKIGNRAFFNTGIYNDESNWDNGVLYVDNCLIEANSYLINGSYTIKEGTIFINHNAFENCTGLTSVTIPNSVTYIPSAAFYGCTDLTSVTIPNSVTFIASDAFLETGIYNDESNWDNGVLYIGSCLIQAKSDLINGSYSIKEGTLSITDAAFFNCSGLTSVTIPNSVTSISDYAFGSCSGLTSITIPNSVTSIGSGAFFYCGGLTSITIPNSVTSIGDEAFLNCNGLTSIAIPNSVTAIGRGAFSGCSGLTKVNYLGTIDEWVEIDNMHNPTYYAKDLYINGELLTDVRITIADSIKKAFAGCASIKSVEIGNSVNYVDHEAFYECTGLTEIKVSSNNKEFTSENEVLFNKDKTILIRYPQGKENTSYIIPNSVTTINKYAFYGCSRLTSITIPNSVISIGIDAFYGCEALTKVNYLGTVDEWAELDFYHNSSNPTYCAKKLYINNELLTDVKITEAKSISDYAFDNCQSIKSVEIGNSVTSIGFSAFYGCSGLTSITIPNSVTNIGSIAFSGCSGLTSITIPSSVTNIGSAAFSGCSGLTSITIPSSVTSIYSDTFNDCSELTSVTIGEGVEMISTSAFRGCEKLVKITALPTSVPKVYQNSFTHYNAELYVPCDAYDEYYNNEIFGSFKEIKCIEAEEVEGSDKVEIEVDENNNATIVWPFVDSASSYELVISKDGVVFCTLIFNEKGQLTSIDFSNRSASVGFQFTVTGLEEASKYDYVIEAKDKVGNVLKSYKGTFTTNGYNSDTAILETLADANITVSGGMISADKEFSIYNTLGKDVTALNGSLQPGIYVVVLGEDRVKVMVK